MAAAEVQVAGGAAARPGGHHRARQETRLARLSGRGGLGGSAWAGLPGRGCLGGSVWTCLSGRVCLQWTCLDTSTSSHVRTYVSTVDAHL